MKNSKVFRGVAAVLAVAAVCVAPAVAAGNLTVGDFVKEYASARNLVATDIDTARTSLEASGVRLPAIDMQKPLTQGDVVSISNAGGMRLTTSTPEAVFSSTDMKAFLVSFGPELDPGQSGGDNGTDGRFNDNGADPRTKGKGKKKGLFKSPSEPL